MIKASNHLLWYIEMIVSSAAKDRPYSHNHREYRVFDLLFACVTLLLLLPLLSGIAILVKLTSPGPVFYKQKRIGQYGQYFQLIKFRTMVLNADKHLDQVLSENEDLRKEFEVHHKLKRDPRITKIGHFLRMMSLDELPQFLNVIRGEMSIVGPRPILYEEELQGYGDHLDKFLSVKPGITGLWQISGRSNNTFEKKVLLDIAYVQEKSFSLNLYIILKTIFVVLKPNGAY